MREILLAILEGLSYSFRVPLVAKELKAPITGPSIRYIMYHFVVDIEAYQNVVYFFFLSILKLTRAQLFSTQLSLSFRGAVQNYYPFSNIKLTSVLELRDSLQLNQYKGLQYYMHYCKYDCLSKCV